MIYGSWVTAERSSTTSVTDWSKTNCRNPCMGHCGSSAGYRMYVLSNACQLFYEYFPRRFDEKLFDGIMVSSTVRLIKPDPRIYELLCSTYDLKPEECVFIDDRADNVEAAQGVGMQGIVFPGSYEGIHF